MTHYPLDFECAAARGSALVIGTGVPNGSGGWTGTLALGSDGHLLTTSEAVVRAQVQNAAGADIVAATPATYGGPGWWYYEIPAAVFSGTQGTLEAYLRCYAADGVLLRRSFHGRLFDRGV